VAGPRRPADASVQLNWLDRLSEQSGDPLVGRRVRHGGAHRLGDLLGQPVVEHVRQAPPGKRRPSRPPVHDDQVNRVFTAAAANQLWLTDITETPHR
jgi:putative transposase